MSRDKGKRGEREFSHLLKDLGFEARRGQQFSGSPDSPDVVTNIEGIHFEVKRVEKLNIQNAMDQAEIDAGEQIPIVAHRKNRSPWMITLKAEDLIAFCEIICSSAKASACLVEHRDEQNQGQCQSLGIPA